MIKEEITKIIIKLQKDLLDKDKHLELQYEDSKNKNKKLFLELIEILDCFAKINENIDKSQDKIDKISLKFLKSYSIIEKKIYRLLNENNVYKLEFPNNKANSQYCKIVDTIKSDCQNSDGEIYNIIKDGYIFNDIIIRPAEVITYKD